MAPRKVRAIANLIKKLSVFEAEAQLRFHSRRAAEPVLKLLKSGIAGAVNNFSLSPENLYISNIFVDEGPMLKRFRPRAFGRAGAIHKKTSHITLILEEKIAGAKKAKKKAAKKTAAVKVVAEEKKGAMEKPAAPKYEAPKTIAPKMKTGGFARRIFRRKAIS